MKKETSDRAVIKATGRSKSEWYEIIKKSGKQGRTHKEIAEFLQREHGLSLWWSQEITVLFEKDSGIRVTGQTKDAGFQVGINKTFALSPEKLWNFIFIENGLGLFMENQSKIHEGSEGKNNSGAIYRITTYKPYSHVRMQWQPPAWDDYSILQIRVNTKDENKTTLSIHQEKLKNQKIRNQMKLFWQELLDNKI